MGCEELREVLALYAGGETTESERIAVESHVGVCAECRAEVEKYREARALLGGLRDGDAPAGTFERMWERVRSEVVPAPRRVPRFDWIVRAAAVLVIGLGIGFAYSVSTSGPAAPASRNDVQVGNYSTGQGDVIPAFGTESRPMPPSMRGFHHSVTPGGAAPAVEGVHLLPRVEAILSPDDTDF